MGKVSSLPDNVLELGRSLVGAPIFLLGCARSGTSILGEAIAAHPGVRYLFEASHIWNQLVPHKDHHRLERDDATESLAPKIYEALAQARHDLGADDGKPAGVLLEKNPKHVIRIPFLHALFPAARFLHIIRDGRDTVASLMFRNRGSQWGHLKIPEWRDWLARYPDENHIRCAEQWRYAVATARQDAASLPEDQYLELRYEDFVRQAPAAISQVLSFLGLEPSAEVDDFLNKVQDQTQGSYHAKRQVRHYVHNHTNRIGRYRENLTAQQLQEVLDVCGALLTELGYND